MSEQEIRNILELLGLSFYVMDEVLMTLVQPHAKAKSRHFRRLGRAALKQGKLAYLKDISDFVQLGEDLRMMPFYFVEFTRSEGINNFGNTYPKIVAQRQRDRTAMGLPSWIYGTIKHNETNNSKTAKEAVCGVEGQEVNSS